MSRFNREDGLDPLAYDMRRQAVFDQERVEVEEAVNSAESQRVVWTDKHPKRIAALKAAVHRNNQYGGNDKCFLVWYQPDDNSITLTSIELECGLLIAEATKNGGIEFTAMSAFCEFGKTERVSAMFRRVCKRLADWVNEQVTDETTPNNGWTLVVNYKTESATLKPVVAVAKTETTPVVEEKPAKQKKAKAA